MLRRMEVAEVGLGGEAAGPVVAEAGVETMGEAGAQQA